MREDGLPKYLRRLLANTPSSTRVWLTEQGGIVDTAGDGNVGPIRQVEPKPSNDLLWLLNHAPSESDRIRRFYAYQWKGDSIWDSGLIDYTTDVERTMYSYYKRRTSPAG